MIIILHRKANIKCDAQSRETCAVNKFTKEKRQKNKIKKKSLKMFEPLWLLESATRGQCYSIEISIATI